MSSNKTKEHLKCVLNFRNEETPIPFFQTRNCCSQWVGSTSLGTFFVLLFYSLIDCCNSIFQSFHWSFYFLLIIASLISRSLSHSRALLPLPPSPLFLLPLYYLFCFHGSSMFLYAPGNINYILFLVFLVLALLIWGGKK